MPAATASTASSIHHNPITSSPFPISSASAAATPASKKSSTSARYASLASEQQHSHSEKVEDWQYGEYSNSTSLVSKLLFSYANPLLDIAAKRQLESKDAFLVPENKGMQTAVSRLEEKYEVCKANAKRKLQEVVVRGRDSNVDDVVTGNNVDEASKQERTSTSSETTILAKALLQSQSTTLVITGIQRLLNTIVQAFPSLIIARLLKQIEAGNSIEAIKPLRSALLLVGVLSVKMITENQYFHSIVKCACEVRGSISGVIFDKSLRLSSNGGGGDISSSSSDKESSKGKNKKKNKKKASTSFGSGTILNLMQSDAATIEMLTLQLHTIWDGLLQISIYITLLYRLLGPPVLWGVSVLLSTIPINAMTLRILNKLSRKELEAKDARMKKMTESIGNMQLLKLQGWERLFSEDVERYREEELRRHKRRGAVRAVNQAVSNAVPTITLVVTLAAYAKTGKPILASTIFTAISLFNQLRFPLFFYPMLIDSMANGKNSLRRLSSYLAQEEIVPYVEYRDKINGGDGGGSIEMRNGNFAWSAAASSSLSASSDTTEQTGKNDPQTAGTGAVPPALSDASVSIAPGEVVAVVGEVGSGKTSLCKALIGELAPTVSKNANQSILNGATSGDNTMSHGSQVIAHGAIAYCAQEAWLPKGTIQESVVFGRDYDEARYMRAIYTAGLDEDLGNGLLTHETDVGEDGSNLSGGQRARVALARALYGEDSAGVYVLDDPLSALDARVGSVVFERVTAKLRQEKAATVFVTNDPNLPRRCDRVILMGSTPDQGSRIVDVGTYDELLARGHDLSTIVHPEVEESDSEEEEDGVGLDGHALHHDVDGDHNSMVEPTALSIENATISSDCHADPDCKNTLKQDPVLLAEHVMPQPSESTKDADTDTASSTTPQKQLSTDDTMSTGAVPRSTYMTYFKSVKSPLLIAAALASYFVSNGSQLFQQLVIARWTEAGKGGAISAAVSATYLNKLVIAAVMVSVSMYFRSYLTMRVGARASQTLHRRMLKSVFQAPLSFFSATPSGQLLTRFGKELEVVDRSLPDGISSVLFCFLSIYFSILALTGVVTPLMAIPLGLVGIFYVKTMTRFRRAARDLKRCESKSRSPIYTHFREALQGAATIRSIPSGRTLWSTKHRSLADENISAYYSVKSLDRWLSVRLETLGNSIVFASAVASVFLTRAGRLKSGSAGWGLTQALSITGLLTWAVRVLTDMETQFMSVQRVSELTDLESTETKGIDAGEVQLNISSSGAGEALIPVDSSNMDTTPLSESALLESGWPWKGHVKFNNVSMRYSTGSPLVLKDVTVDVPAGTTLGVVGRTGSGKSSLLLTLFRLVEVEGAGSITIDDVDIRSLSPQGLRDSISIIPQTPTLFAGTLMYNLDASGRASAEDAWSALNAASPELARQFRESDAGLATMISEGGENLSLGQRQLICLARALLKRSKILVLDEATSSVDSKTDAQVQDTIRREFVQKGVTVITVAHRLDTVLAYDKILVLDAGELVELDAPDELLKRPKGYLRRLYDADRRNILKGSKQMLVKA